MAKSINAQLNDILEEYSKEVEDTTRKVTKEIAKESASKLRSNSPRKTGAYASGWTSKMTDEKTAVVYNKKKPQLTHLLENGHVIRNKKGSYGRVGGRKHIAPVADWAENEFIQKITRKLS